MDSLTQIVLGASVAEAVGGRKIGNKAILWGAIAGTIPDLDVIGSLFLSELDTLASHRAFSHSITFAVMAAPLFAWLVHMYYTKRNKDNLSIKRWSLLFFLCFFTHSILDCFTAYGTQLFQPFSDYRVAFNNISVADPIYTLLFIIPLIIAATKNRTDHKRSFYNYLGMGLSSLYMIFTLCNKVNVDQVFASTLDQENIEVLRYRTNPSILSNVLWYGCGETADSYVCGLYSIFDKDRSFKLSEIPKNHDKLLAQEDDRTINVLDWFTDGYYNVITRRDGNFQINDLRYGTFRLGEESEDDYIFRFPILKQADGHYKLLKAGQGPPSDARDLNMMSQLYERMKGI